MKKVTHKMPEIKLIGLSARTSNAAEMHKETAKIGLTMQRFFSEEIQSKIAHSKAADRVFAVYTDYESDASGAYTYFIGKEVTSFEGLDGSLETLTIPGQSYAKFTNEPGPMPAVCIDMWQKIWKMNASDLGGERAYIADFEVYDERSSDPSKAILDIYIGIK
jgi:predicted transcriptional regulator YdeE